MKLYATTTSERASKGQGGNKSIEITLQVELAGGTRVKIAQIYLHNNCDVKNNPHYLLTVVPITTTEDNGQNKTRRWVTINRPKGNQKKDDIHAPSRSDWIDDGKDDTY